MTAVSHEAPPAPAHAHAGVSDARIPASIVPLVGLPFVAAVIVGLIVSIAGNWLWALEWYHVVGGAGWTTLDLFLGFVLGPMIARMSIPTRAEFMARFFPKILLILPTLVMMTLSSGFQLARHLGYIDSSYPRHAWIVASFIVVGIMAVVALGVVEPANLAVLFEMRKPQPNGELIARLTRRFIYTSGITGVMQVGTLIIMTRIAS